MTDVLPVSLMRGQSLLLGVSGAIVGFLAWRALAALIPGPADAASIAVRIGVAAAALLPAAAVLAAMVMAQMGVRFWQNAFDPTAGKDGRFLRINQRAISNSVEQMAIFVPATLALAAGAPAMRMAEVVALALVFALARLMFWAGYVASPLLRAPGMAAGMAANVTALGWALAVWLA